MDIPFIALRCDLSVELITLGSHSPSHKEMCNVEMPPRVVVIVLNWNSYQATAECLSSLHRSVYPNKAILLVDNGSSDGSADRLGEEFPEVRIIRSARNVGFTGGCNLGLLEMLATDAEYAFLLNNDTVVHELAISHLVEAMELAPDAAMACPKIYFWDPPNILWYAGGTLSIWKGVGKHLGRKQIDQGQFDKSRDVSFVTGCAVLIRREALRRLGLLDEHLFNYSDDTDMSFRAMRAGYRLIYVPDSRIWHREGFDMKRNAGQSFRSYYATRNTLLVMSKHASPVNWVGFLPYFFVNWVLRQAIILLLAGQWRAIGGMARGLHDFFREAKT